MRKPRARAVRRLMIRMLARAAKDGSARRVDADVLEAALKLPTVYSRTVRLLNLPGARARCTRRARGVLTGRVGALPSTWSRRR